MRVAVIPARGGSKRVPRKNIREFAGRPLISYSIDAAHRAGVFDRVIVSTDDTEIAAVAVSEGAEAPFIRPPELSGDYIGTTEVVSHAAEWLIAHGAIDLSQICCIYATAPFIEADDIKHGLELLESGGWQYVFAAAHFPAPVFRAFQRTASQGLEMIFPEYFPVRSQDLPEALHDAGQFYWGRAQAWLSKAKVFDRESTVVVIPHWRVQDIDTEEDWRYAEAMAASLRSLANVGYPLERKAAKL